MPTNTEIKAMIESLDDCEKWSPFDTVRSAASMLRELLAEREMEVILDDQSKVNVLKPAHIRRRNFDAAIKTSKFKGII